MVHICELYTFHYIFQYLLLFLLSKINQQQLCHQMTNNQTYYVVFVSRRHGVYNSWAECQKNVLLYKGSFYKSYTFRKETVRAWVFYAPRWKRSDESSTASKPKFELPVDDQHSFQIISYPYLITFFVGFFVACVLLIVISSLTWVLEMCYEYQCVVMYLS